MSEVLKEDPLPEPSTVPFLWKEPIVTDVTSVAFIVAGCADRAVDVTVEVGVTPDFPIGTGSEGVFTTSQDNYVSGAFRVMCFGLVECIDYYYRVSLTNGADTLYYPDITTTDGPVFFIVGGPPVANPNSLAQVQDRPTNTNQGEFLCTISVANTWPLSLITDAAGIAAFTNNNLRDKTTGIYYQTQPTDNYYFGAWGMWDDGGGMAFWQNRTIDGVYIGNPAPFAAVKTDLWGGHYDSTATGPVGSSDSLGPFYITFDQNCGCFGQDDIYYSNDGNATWNYIGSAGYPWENNGTYSWTALGSGTYWWIVNGDEDMGPGYNWPASGTSAEAGPYLITGTGPPTGWELYNGQNFVTFTSNLTPGWTSESLAEDILNYINTNYPESLEPVDIIIHRYNSTTGLYEVSYFFLPFMCWFSVFPLQEGQTYIVELAPGALIVQPRFYELPNSPIVNPVTVDIYNGMNFRGFPVTTMTNSEELAEDIVTFINTTYGESLTYEDISIITYDSIGGLYITCYYFAPFSMWMNVFPLNPADGYIVEIAPGALSLQPRSYPVQSLYTISGTVYLYDGTSTGGYAPIISSGGAQVEVTWWNSSINDWSTVITNSNPIGQYNTGFRDYINGGVVFINATFDAPYGNRGYNYTFINLTQTGSIQEVICGVPYNVTIIKPIHLSVVYICTPFPFECVITDINGLLAPGYFSYDSIDPDRGFINVTAGPLIPMSKSWIAPPDKVFEGIIDSAPGWFIDEITIHFMPGMWYINISEGGQNYPDSAYLTPWGQFQIDPFDVIPGWNKDYDNITIYVT